MIKILCNENNLTFNNQSYLPLKIILTQQNNDRQTFPIQ